MAKTSEIEIQAQSVWKQLRFQHQLGHFVQLFFIAASCYLLVDLLERIFNLTTGFALPAFVSLAVVAFLSIRFNRYLQAEALIQYLNHQYSWLEFSAQLIPVTPEGVLPQLQRQRVLHTLINKKHEIKAWPDLRQITVVFVGIALIYSVWYVWFPKGYTSTAESGNIESTALPSVPKALTGKLPEVVSIRIEVTPPAYTHKSKWSAKDLSLEAPEQSGIQWDCQLSGAAEAFQVIWNGKDTMTVSTTEKNHYIWKYNLKSAVYYQFRYGIHDKWFLSPVYTLHAIDDQAPVITVQKPGPYTLVLYGQKPEVQVGLQLTDDYGLDRAHLIATVSRGSGESVKFREVELTFPDNITGSRTASLQKKLDFTSLKMEPGDELYFYAETWDQASPSQKSRTDTYFIQWEDTTSQKTSVMAGIALDNMPAYFRSQRQVIIDTEKLLAEKKGLDNQTFKTRSNDLGVDQKVLRLRYGQFLGEEFETSIGSDRHNHEEDEHEGEDEHDHDEHSEKEGSQEKTVEQLHSHDHGGNNSPTKFGELGDMLNGYAHRHDMEDVATFFDETMKSQLKAALAQMWEAELRLRTMRPAEALPYEYKALELIKSLQQKSRVYVEKVGFKPPPLKPAEKRLTGELEDIQSPHEVWDAHTITVVYPHLRQAVSVLEKMHNQSNYATTTPDRQILEKASGELASLILKQPGIRASTLNDLRKVIAGEKISPDTIRRMQWQLQRLLPIENKQPGLVGKRNEPELDNFVNELRK
ncbi:hypothetical protein QNI16_11680 [Cytophagaceae bacterium YF14B1]|uniref:DUF4175 family protein n=1 Tax=Xanthocytophaga flava TaxID=3048013 RepID=A0AAE3QKP7_9BACT|nr:hypothetical protein [Xanthocytophaga flavus]MDJ1481147.1 hypothetical protein [Xanthocytophaga flavus]